jgi:hypothetical protein
MSTAKENLKDSAASINIKVPKDENDQSTSRSQFSSLNELLLGW